MEYALTAGQMRAIEDDAVARGTLTLATLMDRAGAAVAAETQRRMPEGDVVVVCGAGNNGGDGWVAARVLREAGRRVRVVSVVPPGSLAPPAAQAAEAAREAGVPFDVPGSASGGLLAGTSVIIDALFGFGFHGSMGDREAALADAIRSAGAFIVSADVPSGVNADTGVAAEHAVCADVTVTFTALKRGLVLRPGAARAGDVVVADIGLPSPVRAGALEVPGPADLRTLMPWPRPDDHKGARGRVAVVAGSAMYSGAAVLAVSGAMRLGPGYVYAVVPEAIAGVIRTGLPGAIVRAVPATHEGSMARVDAVLTAVADADAIVVGPGLTTVPSVREIVHALLREAIVPVVLDADALNVLGGDRSALDSARASVVVTPHPGEAARLLGCDTIDVLADRPNAALRVSGTRRTCLLKGPGTLVAGDGRLAVVRAGNPGLARAGSGDVLAGMLGTLLAQRVSAFDAAMLAAYLHGRAADIGATELTETCFMASDITRFLPDAVRDLASG